MREGFETWAQREGQIVRCREDKPDEYLVFGTQRQWQIWQAACMHAATASDDAVVLRQHVLDEISCACKQLDPDAGIGDILKLIEDLKAKA
ncbi:MAG: hypothetical protein ACI83P_000366 [Janthinobacterium sp.]|jgi:hypothetical protein